MPSPFLPILLVSLAAGASALAAAAPKPNILLIVSDDHGYADTGFQGSKDIPTPNLDRLARSGTRFTNGYVTHPFCSPTRAGLLTGRYQQRFGHERNPFYDPRDQREGLPTDEILLPAPLKAAGYVTGWVGKWHLGAAPQFSPLRRGFTETFGFVGGGHRFRDWQANPQTEYLVPIERNGTPEEVTDHLTPVFGREAGDFIRRHASHPWFLYLAFNAPHTPHEPTAERLKQFAQIRDPVRQRYAAQLSLMDDAIGEALEALRVTGQDQRTLVFFFSDNGGPTGVNGSSNEPLRGAKGSVYEGGVRVPFVIAWPERWPGGGNDDRMVSSLDVFATALAAAGVALPTDKTYDSVNLLPFLTERKSDRPHARLFWRNGELSAMRDGDWKLVRARGRPDELYNLGDDIAESHDIAPTHRETVEKLGAVLAAWDQELIAPVFEGAGGRRAQKAKRKSTAEPPPVP